MSGVLSTLLELQPTQLAATISRLEDASGRPAVDVRLIAQLRSKVHQKLRELGLDPRDTTSNELYGALQGLVARHDAFLMSALGGEASEDCNKIVQRMASFANKADIPKGCWGIKYTTAKRLLKASPPKRVMKCLHYRSIDSMLKRESIAEILCATRCLEAETWHQKFIKSYRNLHPSDFEQRNIEVIMLSPERWKDAFGLFVSQKHGNVTHLKEFGVIGLLPLPSQAIRGLYITLLPIVLMYINELRFFSAYFKLQQVKSDFGAIVVRTILDDPEHIVIAGQSLHWRVVHSHFGKSRRIHPEIFEPHVQPEDLFFRKAETTLYKLEPALQFWEDLDYVLIEKDNTVVSMGLLDNAVSYCNGLALEDSSVYYARKNLWTELLTRYVGQESLEQEVLAQLGDESLEAVFAGVV